MLGRGNGHFTILIAPLPKPTDILIAMFGIDVRTLRIAWTLFLFALVVGLVYMAGRTLVVFTLAVFLAHLLGPIVGRLERVIPKRWVSRNLSLGLVYSLLLLFIGMAVIPIVTQVGQQAAMLGSRLPAALQSDPLANMGLPPWLEPLRERLNLILRDSLSNLDARLIPILRNAGANLASVLGDVFALILIPILSFFFLQDSQGIHTALVDLVPARNREVTDDILNDLHKLLVQYLQALVILAMMVLIVYSAFLFATGASYAVLLATLAAVLEFIPVAGPLLASAIIVLVALLTGYSHVWALILFLILFRLVQDYVVSPKLMSAGVEIHPLLVLFGVLAGEQIAGIPGMFFSVPVIAALRIVVVRMRRKKIDTAVLAD